MTDFNALPLAEKIKQAQAGDIVVTNSGAKLPVFGKRAPGVLALILNGLTVPIPDHYIFDIIRPTERKVPKVVERLSEMHRALSLHQLRGLDNDDKLGTLILVLANHFDSEAQP